MANRFGSGALQRLVDDLRSTHGDNLVSVVLYGSAAAGETAEWRTDYNLLVALNSITPADLRAAQAPTREWQKLGHPLPVYFTAGELLDAADVFPIEFQRMANARKILFGADPFTGLELSNAHLRHQTEYELRSKLIQLRRLYIPASLSTKKLVDLMCQSLLSFSDLFRAVLLLLGSEAPVTQAECVGLTAEKLGLDPAPFTRILSLGESADEPSLSDAEANELFGNYLTQIESVITAVDQIAE
ncbi:MAG: hypothetical protein ABIZ95_00010 [Pyrinomonadaceae bacterium]